MKKITLFTLVFSCCLTIGYSQPGELDPSFGTRGIVRTDFDAAKNEYSVNFNNALIHPNGTIYIFSESFITRLLNNGAIDVSYGKAGYSQPVSMRFASGVIQSDGKILVIGSAYNLNTGNDFGVARYNTNGTLDTTFSTDGTQTTDFGAIYEGPQFVTQQNDGKIVVVGSTGDHPNYDIAFARYNADGTLDTTFSNDGKMTSDFVSGSIDAVAIQNDGKFVVMSAIGFVARYNAEGTVDTSFSKDGSLSTGFTATSVAIQSDGKIVVAGYTGNYPSFDFAIARYNTDGTPDTSFSEDGRQTTDFTSRSDVSYSVTIQNDGKILVAGSTGTYDENGHLVSNFALARYNTDGTLDTSFSEDGKNTVDFGVGNEDIAHFVGLQSDGKIVVAGESYATLVYDVALARCNTDGSLDTTFSGDGILSNFIIISRTSYTSTAVQNDGKIVVAGSFYTGYDYDFAIARYNTNGTLDSTFSEDGKQTCDFASGDDVAVSVTIQSDGKIVVAGTTSINNSRYRPVLTRYNTDGTLDTTFSEDGKLSLDFGFAAEVALQTDGKILVAGSINGFIVARYNTDGTLDDTFLADSKVTADFDNFSVQSVAIQSDGKIVVAGHAYTDYADNFFVLVRYNINGTLDTTFSDDGRQTTDFASSYSDRVKSVTIQSDAKIVVAGSTGDLPQFAIARYNIDGTLDTTFSNDGKQISDFTPFSEANSLAIQSDGKIVVAGYTSVVGGPVPILARYNTDGSLDKTFGEDGKQVTEASEEYTGISISDIAISGNKLYAAGAGAYIGSHGLVARYLLNDENQNNPPTVTLSIPYNIVKYSAPARIKLIASAADEDGRITKVQFYNGTTLLHTEVESPYGFLWIDVPVGNYTLTAKAFDNSGNVTTSNSIEVSVVDENVPPVVSIVSPVDDTTYTGPATIQIIARAKDPNDRIAKVEFYSGSALIRTEYIYPYRYRWSNVQPGTYTITAKAYDDKGLSTASDPVTVTVTNASIVSSRPSSVISKTDLNAPLSLRLSPNPARSTLQIFTKGLQLNKPSTISVISESGVVLKSIQSNVSDKVVQLDVSSLVSGVYTIKVVSGDKVLYKRFVKL